MRQPTSFRNPSQTILIAESMPATFFNIDVTYEYTPVPEPKTFWMIAAALGIAFFTRRAMGSSPSNTDGDNGLPRR